MMKTCAFVFLRVPQTPVSPPKVPPEPEPPNPFNELTDKELEEYRKEVARKRDGGTDGNSYLNVLSNVD